VTCTALIGSRSRRGLEPLDSALPGGTVEEHAGTRQMCQVFRAGCQAGGSGDEAGIHGRKRVSVRAGARGPLLQHLPSSAHEGAGGMAAALGLAVQNRLPFLLLLLLLAGPPGRCFLSQLTWAIPVSLVPSGFRGRKVLSTARPDKHAMIYL